MKILTLAELQKMTGIAPLTEYMTEIGQLFLDAGGGGQVSVTPACFAALAAVTPAPLVYVANTSYQQSCLYWSLEGSYLKINIWTADARTMEEATDQVLRKRFPMPLEDGPWELTPQGWQSGQRR